MMPKRNMMMMMMMMMILCGFKVDHDITVTSPRACGAVFFFSPQLIVISLDRFARPV
jgi:hypothetical protein